MTSKGGYAAPALSRQGGDRFYNPPAVRRQQQILLEQQQMMQRQQQQEHQARRKEAVQQESSSGVAAENLNGVDVSSKAAAFPVTRSSVHVSPAIVTNLDRLMEAVTPFVEARRSLEVSTRPQRNRDLNSAPFYYLEDLWEAFSEWSVYGAGVPLLLYGKEPIEQFYVPFLSGIQLYMDKSTPSRIIGPSEDTDGGLTTSAGSSDSEGDKRGKSALNLNMSRLSLADNSSVSSSSHDEDNSPGAPLFQYLEHEQPYNRRPFSQKISLLASQSPELSKCRSSDLHPMSWMCVAWYPIYRIPIGPTLQDLDASFLTFHLLSTQPRNNQPALFHAPNTRLLHGIIDPTPRISLPVFALASYKLKGSIVSPSAPHEFEQEDNLLQAADKWMRRTQVNLPDYQFFRSHYYSQRR